jgi:Transcriptional regulators
MITDGSALDNIGFFISRTQSQIRKRFLPKLRPYHITPEQWVLFASLSKKEGISVTDLSSVSFKDKAYTTRLIDNLEEQGLIRREENQNDKRSSLIFLTDKGKKRREELVSMVIEFHQWMIEPLSEEEIRELKYLLNKVYVHIK